MLEINKRSDIIIPFDKVGDKDWEINTLKILEAVAYNWSKKLMEPIGAETILLLEKKLGTTLPAGLKTFYQTFGLADIGEQLQAFEDIDYIKNIWATAPQYSPSFTGEDEEHLPFLISFSDYLGNGNMFCYHSETKEIYYYDHNTRPYITRMFNTADDYLKGCLVFAQQDFFGEETSQEQVSEWTEEIAEGLVGKAIAKKWRY